MSREDFEKLLDEEGEKRRSLEWRKRRSLADVVKVRK
jgi:hypothetical protein